MHRPRVSICIPSYNNATYLGECIESALRQTYASREVIVSDDASTDLSLEVASRFGDRVRLFAQHKNRGQPRNTMHCIERAQGEYILILHSDDALLPNCLQRLVPLLDAHGHVGLAAGERFERDEAGPYQAIAPFYDGDYLIPGERQAKVFMLAAMVPCQVLVRKSVLLAAGGIDERHIVNLDGLLWFRCALQADVAYVQTPVCVYRRHANSTTSQCNRTVRHMMDYHATLMEMFRLAADRPYLRQYFDIAEKRVGELTVRYCRQVLQERDFSLARRFLALAQVFDPGVVERPDFQLLQCCLASTDGDPLTLYKRLATNEESKRRHSYEPPEGSRPLPEQLDEYLAWIRAGQSAATERSCSTAAGAGSAAPPPCPGYGGSQPHTFAPS
ncbi:MAG: glycosyltransferase family 2 protein [Pirellulaceae bacterium]